MNDDKSREAMTNLDNLVDKLFGVAKKEVEKVEEVIEEVIEPTEQPEADE
jgi:hypothetical protein